MDKIQILEQVAETLSIMSSYSQEKIIELINYSEDTQLQLIALLSPSHKDVLANKLSKRFDKFNTQDFFDTLFSDIKTVEKLIDFIYEKYK
jgi:hypothetical protein